MSSHAPSGCSTILKHLGFTPLDAETIELVFCREIGSGEGSVAACNVDWSRVAAAMGGFEQDARFCHLLGAVDERGDARLADTLRAAEPQRRRKLLIDLIKTQAANVLGVATDEILEDQPLGDLRLDSLMAFELSALLELKLSSHLPLSALQGNRTVQGLADQMERALFSAKKDSGPHIASSTTRAEDASTKTADIRLRYLPATLLVEPDTQFEAAALTYIPEQFSTKGGLGPAELQAALGTEPFLSGLVEASIGRVGTFMLPLRASELFLNPSRPETWFFVPCS